MIYNSKDQLIDIIDKYSQLENEAYRIFERIQCHIEDSSEMHLEYFTEDGAVFERSGYLEPLNLVYIMPLDLLLMDDSELELFAKNNDLRAVPFGNICSDV